MSLLVATQITAVATAVLALFAIVTAWYARNAFRGQSEEVGLLQQDRQREAEERRWAQAIRVYITLDVFPGNKAHPGNEYVVGRSARPPAITATVHNTGGRPVYDVRVHWVNLDPVAQAGTEDQLGTLGPQDDTETERSIPTTVAKEKFMPIAYFRDAAGLRWTITPNGYLDPVDGKLAPGTPEIAVRAAAKEAQRLQIAADEKRTT